MPKVRIETERRRETGERLRFWRTRRECSQAEVARAANITQALEYALQ